EDLAKPVVPLGALGDVHRRHRHLLAQRLHDRVASGDPLGVTALAARPTAALLGSSALLRLGDLVRLVVLALGRLRRRSPPLQAATDLSAGADGRLLARLADRALARGVAGHLSSPSK